MKAVLNIADVGALESTAHMLESIGYKCKRPDPALLEEIRWRVGCEGAYSVEELVKDWGYPEPTVTNLATLEDIKDCDLFVDVKAYLNYPKIVTYWPHLKDKVLWCCLNGGDPLKRKEEVWANPLCPVLTNNQWYAVRGVEKSYGEYARTYNPVPWDTKAYTCYPPYMRLEQRSRNAMSGPPICLIHNVYNWGYKDLVDPLRELGVKFYGINGSPDGMIRHEEAMNLLSNTICMVHLKNGDTVGYAMVEALTSGVPFVCTQFYIDECKLGELLKPGETCFTFDPMNAVRSLSTILKGLQLARVNQEVGSNGKKRYLDLMWNKERDSKSFTEFMERNFK